MRRISLSVLCEIGILKAMITILGSLKLPNIVPGIEFQLSAPLAVAVCSVFGFKKYFLSGCLSSLLCLILGTQNILNVAIAMQFRLIVGILLLLFPGRLWMIVLAGPIASTVSRLSLYLFLGNFTYVMMALAIPGMIFTAAAAPVFVKILRKIKLRR